jgi:hypothetical protein
MSMRKRPSKALTLKLSLLEADALMDALSQVTASGDLDGAGYSSPYSKRTRAKFKAMDRLLGRLVKFHIAQGGCKFCRSEVERG